MQFFSFSQRLHSDIVGNLEFKLSFHGPFGWVIMLQCFWNVSEVWFCLFQNVVPINFPSGTNISMTIDDNYKYQIWQIVDIVDPPDPQSGFGGGGQGVPKNLTVQDSAVLHGFHGFSQFQWWDLLTFWLLGNLWRNKAFVESENGITYFNDFPPLMIVAGIDDDFEEPIWQQQIPCSGLLFRIFGRSLSAETTQIADLWTTLMMMAFCRHLQHNKHKNIHRNENGALRLHLLLQVWTGHGLSIFWNTKSEHFQTESDHVQMELL